MRIHCVRNMGSGKETTSMDLFLKQSRFYDLTIAFEKFDQIFFSGWDQNTSFSIAAVAYFFILGLSDPWDGDRRNDHGFNLRINEFHEIYWDKKNPYSFFPYFESNNDYVQIGSFKGYILHYKCKNKMFGNLFHFFS